MNKLDIAMIMDDGYVMPTATAISSIIDSKAPDTQICFYLLYVDGQFNIEKIFDRLKTDTAEINILRLSGEQYKHLHISEKDSFCVATPAALLKFALPEVLPHLAKVLYLDGDIVVKRDLYALFCRDLGNNYVAAAIDSGALYFKHKYVELVQGYFNSGVMLLNLAKMRMNDITAKLIATKLREKDSQLMDQNIFNLVFDGQVNFLPLTYNLLYPSLARASRVCSMEAVNECYQTDFASLEEVLEASYIVHYSSKDKPWKINKVPAGELWQRAYEGLLVKCNKDIALYNDRCLVPVRAEEPPKVSVIIPVYNTEKYLAETLNSVARQSLKELEIICLDDGSTDNSLQYLLAFAAKEKRCAVIQQSNGGLSRARNVALKYARGEYVYFLDSDDLLKDEALHNAYNLAKADSLDFVVFSGEVFFETDALKDAHQGEIKLFALKNSYPGIYMGQNLYCQLVKNHDYNVSVCLKLIARQFLVDKKLEFLEGCIHEDNFFSQQLFLLAERAAILPEALFLRRVREQSIVTNKNPYKHFVCSFRIYFEMVKFTYSLKLNPQSQDIIQAKLDNFFRNTVKKAFLTLDEKEQKIPALLSASLMDRALFDALGNNLLLEAARAEQNKSLLKLVEKKDKLVAYKAQAQARMERLEQAKARLQEKSEKLLTKKAALQARCERLEQERASLKESCNKAKAELQLLAQELELLKDSAAFKLGKLMNLGK